MTTNTPQHTNDRKDSSHQGRPYWRRAHHDWKFWVAIFLMLLAMAIYVKSNDFSMWPDRQMQHKVP